MAEVAVGAVRVVAWTLVIPITNDSSREYQQRDQHHRNGKYADCLSQTHSRGSDLNSVTRDRDASLIHCACKEVACKKGRNDYGDSVRASSFRRLSQARSTVVGT